MTKPGIEEESQLAFWVVVRLPLVLQISPATAINDPDFRKGIATRTLKFCRILAKFEDLCLVHIFE